MRLVTRLVLLATLAPMSLGAQRGGATIAGVVLTDSTRRPIPDAVVAIPALNRSTSTDTLGRFRLADLRAGTHQLVVRRLGYSPYAERFALATNQTLDHEILLVPATVLDTVAVTASAIIRSFEEHRAVGLGRFLTRQELGKQETRRLSEVIAQFPGARIVSGKGSYAWLASKRGVTSLNPKTCNVSKSQSASYGIDEADARLGAKQCECYAQVYLDNNIVYRGGALPGEPLTNLNGFSIDQIEAIEYYAGPAQTPLKYSLLNSQCGVLVIHTRRSP